VDAVCGQETDTYKEIELITGGSVRVMSGAKPNRLRGGNSKLFVLSELQAMDPRVIDVIEPILEANGGTLIANFTANGDSATKGLLEAWQNDPDAFVSILTADDTPVFTEQQMERIRRRTIERFVARGQSEEEAIAFVEQEYYCSWDSPVAGAYFGAAMRQAQADGRIRSVPYEPQLPVDTFWDLGIDDSMSIWFVQLFGSEVGCIEYYESSGEGMPHYVGVLRDRKYVYGQHHAPHDIEVRELTTGVSRRETAHKLGIDFLTVKKPARKEDGIDAIRTMLPRCYFDAVKCKRGLDGLKGYHKRWNDKTMVYMAEPVHDWTSHPTYAFQTLALSNPEQRSEPEVYTAGWIARAANQWRGER
jgi:phage terminase large subunit